MFIELKLNSSVFRITNIQLELYIKKKTYYITGPDTTAPSDLSS